MKRLPLYLTSLLILLLGLAQIAQPSANNLDNKPNTTTKIVGQLNDAQGPITQAQVFLNYLKDENCVKLFKSTNYSEKTVQKLQQCMQDIGPISPDSKGGYSFNNLTPGYYALVVSWNTPDKMKAPIMAFQKGDFTISYYQGAKYNTVATSKVIYFAGKEDLKLDFDYTKGTITNEVVAK